MRILNFKHHLLILVSILCAVCNGYAQRTAIGTFYAGAQANFSFSGFGGGVEAGLYNALGQWQLRISDTNRNVRILNDDNEVQGTIGYMHLTFEGDYLWRIVNNQNRTLNFYGGAGFLLGVELIDPMNRWPANSVFPFDGKNKFLYGLAARAELEWFFLRTVPDMALTLGGALPFNFSSRIRKFNQEISLGIRYNF